MKTITDIYNSTLNQTANVEKSLYYNEDDKLIRFSDHKCNYSNIIEHNKNISEILLVFVNPLFSESEMQKNAEEIEANLNISVNYVYYSDNEDDNTLFVKTTIKRFLNK